MGWLVLWTAIGIGWVVTMAACGWRLWRKGKALFAELSTQGRTLGEVMRTLDELGWSSSRPASPANPHQSS